jgi:hypothetical protein
MLAFAIHIVSSSGSDTGGCMLDWHLLFLGKASLFCLKIYVNKKNVN